MSVNHEHSLGELLPIWDHGKVDAVRVISKRKLRAFWERHEDAEQPLKAWHKAVEQARWKTSASLKERFATASIISANRVVFNIGGNKYRLVTAINYPFGTVFIRFIGTHAEYDDVDARTI
jgi:mRNA interferase HigB